MALANFRMLIHEFLNKDPDIVPEEDPLVVLDSKSDMLMAKNGKDNKHKIYICKDNLFCKVWRKVQDAQD